jgi:hypothetical protein
MRIIQINHVKIANFLAKPAKIINKINVFHAEVIEVLVIML